MTLPSCGFSVSCQAPAKRHIIYGTEEGHDVKNEVRKERWIRKRQRRPLGGGWRESQVKKFYIWLWNLFNMLFSNCRALVEVAMREVVP